MAQASALKGATKKNSNHDEDRRHQVCGAIIPGMYVWNEAERSAIAWGLGVGVVLAVLGTRTYLRWETGGFSARHDGSSAQSLVFHRARKAYHSAAEEPPLNHTAVSGTYLALFFWCVGTADDVFCVCFGNYSRR